jgi:hypothetical protein
MGKNELFLKDVPAAIAAFPELSLVYKNDNVILAGNLTLRDNFSEAVDRYEIEIHPTDKYPDCFPLVHEVGGRIPNNIDWHVYPSGHFCITVPAQERLICLEGINLVLFITDHLLGFLFNQTYRRQNGYFYKERAHGITGKLQFYSEYLQIPNLGKVIPALRMIATSLEQGSHSKCFCGSKRKFKKCHRRSLRNLGRKVGANVKLDFNEIQNLAVKLRNQSTIK